MVKSTELLERLKLAAKRSKPLDLPGAQTMFVRVDNQKNVHDTINDTIKFIKDNLDRLKN